MRPPSPSPPPLLPSSEPPVPSPSSLTSALPSPPRPELPSGEPAVPSASPSPSPPAPGASIEAPAPTISFKKRARPRKRPRPSSPPAGADIERVAVRAARRAATRPTSALTSRTRRDTSWRVAHEADDGVVEDFAATAATGARRDDGSGGGGVTKSSSAAKGSFGPLRAPTHIRTNIVTDFQPDVCKDYKETGFCGFGDACKFLHDRSVTKAGWQLEKDWIEEQEERRRKRERGVDPDAKDDGGNKNVDDDGLPFACFICRSAFKAPVVSLCRHYFCEECAVERLATDSTCAACGKQLRGVLNTATKIVTKMERAGRAG